MVFHDKRWMFDGQTDMCWSKMSWMDFYGRMVECNQWRKKGIDFMLLNQWGAPRRRLNKPIKMYQILKVGDERLRRQRFFASVLFSYQPTFCHFFFFFFNCSCRWSRSSPSALLVLCVSYESREKLCLQFFLCRYHEITSWLFRYFEITKLVFLR